MTSPFWWTFKSALQAQTSLRTFAGETHCLDYKPINTILRSTVDKMPKDIFYQLKIKDGDAVGGMGYVEADDDLCEKNVSKLVELIKENGAKTTLKHVDNIYIKLYQVQNAKYQAIHILSKIKDISFEVSIDGTNIINPVILEYTERGTLLILIIIYIYNL